MWIFSGRIVIFRPSRSITFDTPTKPATNSVRGRSYTSAGDPICSIRPSLKTAMRSLIVSASSWSCVTYTKVIPSSRCSSLRNTCISWRSFRSSAPSGSSRSSTVGLLTIARASATRWRWPPESCTGLRPPSLGRRTRSSTSSAFARRSRRLTPLTRSPYSTFSSTVMCGNSA